MTRILIYGDSIPWGLVPASKFDRFDFDERWPGILQYKLGSNFQVIEECLCARTIDSDDLRPGFEGRNGMAFLPTCLDSHYPIDVIIISLGLNELKSIYDWTPHQVAAKMGALINTVKARRPNSHEYNPRILLLSQPIVKNTGFWGELWVGSAEKSQQLFEEYEKLADELNVEFVDLSGIQTDSKDGVHIDAKGHSLVAEKLLRFLT